ncbi:response regulator transcription factor [Lapidilactobacillus dextrinicus]|uniref:response regulator transcription factor n=1 Tax=Lapidilactobacillus dextrinicus TaxID=51664 RepID=UPI0022E45E48|nr:response regulator transcription factor [Lapidilactobacillus dextrinicus]
MQKQILVLTKQLKIFISLNETLSALNYSLLNVTTIDSAHQAVNTQELTGIIIDLSCGSWLEVSELLSDARQQLRAPIIVISSEFSIAELQQCFALHVDDYVVWQEPAQELLLRLQQRLWFYEQTTETNQTVKTHEQETSATIQLGDLTIDLQHFQVLRDQLDLGLTPKEFKLLMYLIKHNGQVLAREQIMTEIWGYDELDSSRIVDIHISHLRDKIELDSKNPQIITTVRGFGYLFEDKNLKIAYKNQPRTTTD